MGLYCLPLIQQLLDTILGTKLYLLNYKNKHGKELRCPNTKGNLGFFSANKNEVIYCIYSKYSDTLTYLS